MQFAENYGLPIFRVFQQCLLITAVQAIAIDACCFSRPVIHNAVFHNRMTAVRNRL